VNGPLGPLECVEVSLNVPMTGELGQFTRREKDGRGHGS